MSSGRAPPWQMMTVAIGELGAAQSSEQPSVAAKLVGLERINSEHTNTNAVDFDGVAVDDGT